MEDQTGMKQFISWERIECLQSGGDGATMCVQMPAPVWLDRNDGGISGLGAGDGIDPLGICICLYLYMYVELVKWRCIEGVEGE